MHVTTSSLARSSALALALTLLSCTTSSDDTGRVESACSQEDAGADASGPPSLFAGGAGTEAAPYQISNCAQLQAMETALYAHFVITADIDCTGFDAGDGKGFRPVGDDGQEFGGRVDGGGHIVIGLRAARPNVHRVGLFGRTRWAVIRRLGIVAPSIVGKDDVGALIGWQRWGLVEECFVRGGSVTGRERVGALVGNMHHSKVYNSYAQAELTCTKWDNANGGGQSQWNRHCGQLVGTTTHGIVVNSYAAVDGSPNYGLAGGSSPRTHTNAFYDCEIISGCAAPHVERRVTAELQSEAYLDSREWDFNAVWGIAAPATYPCLLWENGCGGPSCAPDDVTCDGVDDDCDGDVDEAFAPVATSCGAGVCGAAGSTSCVSGTVVDSCEVGTATGADADCDGLDNDCDSSTDEAYAPVATSCGVGACGATGATSCVSGAVVDSCEAGVPAGTDATCDNVDSDCDGDVDEGYAPVATSCGLGACGATGATSCVSGAVVDSCDPGTPTGMDETCDSVDSDCDGSVDEGYSPTTTSCGVGACGATGATSCVSGAVVDSCEAGTPTGTDATCNGLDEDCDGDVDEAFAPVATSCGAGVCGAAGSTSCVSGAVVDSCEVGTATGADADCDGLDNDCDGSVDEGYVSTATSCGVGACGATGATSCVSGAVVDSCEAGTPTGTDATCDNVDSDCDGDVDEGYAPVATSCGVGACGATGATSCVAGTVLDSCEAGSPTGTDATCDSVDTDCDGSVDEGYAPVATSCGVGACGATGATSCVAGAVVDSCEAGTPTGTDTTCDGLDEDCDGDVDEAFAPVATSCGAGVCGAAGSTSCVSGAVVDSCEVGTATGADADCDGLDNDCDSSTDEAYAPVATSCGVGACGATGATSCVSGAVVDSCEAGTPAGTDATCDNVDSDCDGDVDEGYAPVATSCGLGACGATGATSCVSGAVVDSCDPGTPIGMDETCDSVDSDCDGSVDEGYSPTTTSCGVGACGATGATSCVSGAVVDSCEAGTPTGTDATCNGLDEDCDGDVDEAFAPVATSCGAGVCGAAGSTSCVSGAVVDSCEVGTATGADADCDGLDNDCDGSVDEGYVSTATSCGVGACGATGATSCVAGAVVDSCEAGVPAGMDATCDNVDSDCDGDVDEGYAPVATSCGVGACGATGATSCVAGTVLDSCEAGSPTGTDATCDSVDSDCDGSVDEGYTATATSCGVGACAAVGAVECVSGTLHDTCTEAPPAAQDGTCNGRDDDCDASIDEDFAPSCNGTRRELCQDGVPVSVECTDDDLCNGQESCVAGACLPGTPIAATDGDACTLDVCDPATGAVSHPGAPEGTPCPDANLCDGEEMCLGGICSDTIPVELPLPCDTAVPTPDFVVPELQDVASARNGGTVASYVGSPPSFHDSNAGVTAVDRRDDRLGWTWVGRQMTIDLAGNEAHLVDRISFWPGMVRQMERYEVWSSLTGIEGDFIRIGTGTVPPIVTSPGPRHDVAFTPTRMRYVRLVSLDTRADNGVQWFQVRTRDHNGGVVSSPAAGATAVATGNPMGVVTGPLGYTGGALVWGAQLGDLTVDLAGDLPVLIDRVQIAGRSDGWRNYEILVSRTGNAVGDFSVVHSGALAADSYRRLVRFPPVLARYVRVRMLDSWNTTFRTLSAFHVIAANDGPAQVPFDDASVAGDSPIVAWHWDFGDGTTSLLRDPVHTFPGAGTYAVTLTVTDAYGHQRSTTKSYTAHLPPTPSFELAPQPLTAGLMSQIVDTTDHDVGIIDRYWSVATLPYQKGEFDGTFFYSTGATPTFRAFDVGSTDVSVRVVDARFTTNTVVTPVTAVNRPPRLGESGQGGDGVARSIPWGQPEAFRVYASDREPILCHWDFGNGETRDIPQCGATSWSGAAWVDLLYAWPDPGDYQLTLTVTDPHGASAVTAWDVHVQKHDLGISTQPVTDISGGGLHDVGISLGDLTIGSNVGVRELTVGTTTGGSMDVTTGPSGEVTASIDFGSGAATELYAVFDGDSHYNPSRMSQTVPELVAPDRPDNCGRDFWVAYGKNGSVPNERQLKSLFFYGEHQTAVRISGAVNGSVFVVPGRGAHYTVDPSDELRGFGVTEPVGIHIESDRVVCVHAVNAGQFSTDGFLALPVDALGTDYVVAGYQGANAAEVGEADILATQDGTEVTIVANSIAGTLTNPGGIVGGTDLPRLLPGQSATIVLDAGEAIHLAAAGFWADISGTRIHSSAPVAVFGGHGCATVPWGVASCDMLVEMMLPVDRWGTSHLLAPFALRTGGFIAQVAAGHPNTEVYRDGVLVDTLDAGEIIYIDVNTPALAQEHVHITTSQPALVTQYMKGVAADAAGTSDPSQMTVIPTAQFQSNYLVATDLERTNPPYRHFVRLIAQHAQIGGLRIDGQVVSAGFTPIGTSGYSAAEVEVTRGVHRLTHVSATVPFGAYVYGSALAESYAYPAGLRTAPLAGGCTPTTDVPGDGVDNDCDGRYDEELANGLDDDSDGLVDEDLVFTTGTPFNVAPIALDREVFVREDFAMAFTLAGFDANGDSLTYSVLSQPGHGTLSGSGQAFTFTPAANFVGSDSFTYRVNDGHLDSPPGTVRVTVFSQNDAPQITMASVVSVVENVPLQLPCVATDDAPTSELTWTLVSGPSGMTVDSAAALLEWVPGDLSSVGATLRATDAAGASHTFSFALNVQDIPENPFITSLPVTQVAFDASYHYRVVAQDYDPGTVLSYQLLDGPTGMSISGSTGVLSWTPSIADAGDHDVLVIAYDQTGLASAPQAYVLTVQPDTMPPAVTLTATPALIVPGATTTLRVQATDNHAFTVQSLVVDGTSLSVGVDGRATYVGVDPGVHVATATVVDPTGNVGTATTLIRVLHVGDNEPPTVALTSPEDSAELTYLHDVVGSVSDENLYQWRVSMRFVGEAAETVVLQGSSEVSNDVLGQLDTTQMLNGIYILRLVAEDVNGLTSDVTRPVSVSGDAKLGAVRFSLTDIAMPTHDVPITVTRHYDSTDPREGAFGFGWRMEESESTVQVSRPLGDGVVIWTRKGDFIMPCTGTFEQKQHSIEVRLSDDEYYVFGMDVSNFETLSGSCTGDVFFEQVAGTVGGAELLPVSNTRVRSTAYGAVRDPLTLPPGALMDIDTGDVWNATQFVLELPDGRRYQVDTERGTTALEGRNGFFVSYNGTSTVHSGGRYVVFERDNRGRVVQIRDQDDRTVEYSYDAAGDLVAVADQLGRVTTYEYDPLHAHHLVAITDHRGVRVLAAEYQDDGRISESCDADSICEGYEYDLPGRRGVTRNTDGAEVAVGFDSHGRIHTRTDALGNTWTYTHDPATGRLTRETDPTGVVRTYEYDGQGRIVASTDWHGELDDPAEFRTTIEYDGASTRPVRIQDAAGAVELHAYDSRGNEVSYGDGSGLPITTTYDTNGFVTGVADGPFGWERFTNDGQGQVTQVVADDGTTTTMSWTNDGQVASVAESGAAPTVFQRDPFGRPTSITGDFPSQELTYGEGGTVPHSISVGGSVSTRHVTVGGRFGGWDSPSGDTRVEHDAHGRAAQITDPFGGVTQLGYDAAGRLESASTPHGDTVTMTRDGAGRVTATVNSFGYTTRTEYDGAGRVTATVDGRHNRWEQGRPTPTTTRVVSPLGHTTTTLHNAYGVPLSVTWPDGTSRSFEYLASVTFEDAADFPTRVVDEGGRARTYTYTDDALLVALSTWGGATYGVEYEGSEVSAVVDPTGERTVFDYNTRGWLAGVHYADGTSQTLEHDDAGNITSVEHSPTDIVTFTYDEGRVATRTGADGQWAYTYGPASRLDAVSGPGGVTQYEYLGLGGDLSSVTEPGGAVVTHESDALGRRVGTAVQTGTGDESAVRYQYDANDNLVGVTIVGVGDIVQQFDADNRLVLRTLPNGTSTSWTYSSRGLVTLVQHRDAGESVIRSFDYQRLPGGEPSRITREDGSYTTFEYDAANRITAERAYTSAGVEVRERLYAYDAAGNRTRVTTDGTEVLDYVTGPAQQVLRVEDGGAATREFAYDHRGRVSSYAQEGVTTSVSYDSRGQITMVSRPGQAVAYEHDGLGRRRAVSGAATRTLVYGDAGETGDVHRPMATLDELGELSAHVIYIADQPVARVDGSGVVHYYLADAMNTVSATLDESGDVASSTEVDAFGNVLATTGDSGDAAALGWEFGYHGGEVDPVTGWVHFSARDYDPATGRFLQRDPAEPNLREIETMRWYDFAEGNPNVKSDATGLFTISTQFATLNVRSVLVNTARAQFRSFVSDQIQSVAGQVLWSGLESVLYSVMPIGTLPGLPGATASAQGIQFEQMLRAAICSVVPDTRYLWVEPRISPVTGKAMTPGFSCNQPTSLGGAHWNLPRPDAIVSRMPPDQTDSNDKSWLIAEFKRSLKGTRSRWRRQQRNQFRALTGYGSQFVYGRLTALVVWRSGYPSATQQAAETALVINMIVGRNAVPLVAVIQ